MHSDSTTRVIPLTRGKVALVDASDYDYLSQFNWRDVHGYACRSEYLPNQRRQTTTSMARVIMGAATGEQVDHINGDKLDNRRMNLRLCTLRQNCQNKSVRSDSHSGLKGVMKSGRAKHPWRAYIVHEGFRLNLGHFSTAEDAAVAYDEAAVFFHGEFARLNFG